MLLGFYLLMLTMVLRDCWKKYRRCKLDFGSVMFIAGMYFGLGLMALANHDDIFLKW